MPHKTLCTEACSGPPLSGPVWFPLLWLCPGTLSLWRSLKPLRHHSSLWRTHFSHTTQFPLVGAHLALPQGPHTGVPSRLLLAHSAPALVGGDGLFCLHPCMGPSCMVAQHGHACLPWPEGHPLLLEPSPLCLPPSPFGVLTPRNLHGCLHPGTKKKYWVQEHDRYFP